MQKLSARFALKRRLDIHPEELFDFFGEFGMLTNELSFVRRHSDCFGSIVFGDDRIELLLTLFASVDRLRHRLNLI